MCGSFLFRLTNICKLDIIALLPNKTTREMNRVISAQDEYVVTGESRGQFRVIQKKMNERSNQRKKKPNTKMN